MRKVLPAAVLAFVACTPASADTLTRCFIETGVAGTFLAAGERHAQGSIGTGCDVTINRNFFVGAGIRADLGDTSAAVALARLGYNVNPHLAIYGIAGWSVSNFKLDRKSGQLVLGAGAETAVGAVSGLALFGEATVAAAKVGAATTDDLTIRTGLRWRF